MYYNMYYDKYFTATVFIDIKLWYIMFISGEIQRHTIGPVVAQAYDCKRDMLWVPSPLEEIIYIIF